MKFILDQFNLHLYYSLQNYIPKQKSPPPTPYIQQSTYGFPMLPRMLQA